MLDAIYIPTYRRPTKQLTWRKLPKKWQEITYLVVDEKDASDTPDMQHVICPVQGTGIAEVREWIAQHGVGKRYAVFDDDIYEFCYTRRQGEEEKFPLYNTRLYDADYDVMFALVDSQMDKGYHMGGLDVCWNPPIIDKDIKYCNRQAAAHFYDGAKFAFEKLDWTSIPYAEDYSTILQYLTGGNQNWTSYRYRIRPTTTAGAGGCENQRTIEKHNASMVELQKRFPDFVSLREKTVKLGGWGNQVKLAANIQWTRAWKSSQKPEDSLESLM